MKTSHTPALLKIVSCAALLLMGASLTFVSCSKSKVTPKSTNLPANAEQPFQAAVNNASLVNGKVAYGQGDGAEIGYRVHFSVGGTIIQLGANMATNGTYTVSFWRTSDTLLMARASVTVTDTSKFAYTNIAAINVIPDTSYTVSIHIANGVTQLHWVYTWDAGARRGSVHRRKRSCRPGA